MQITVYKNFSKRINSTKSPASGGTPLNVVIKDYSNIETPSFTLTVSNIDQNSGFLDVNYVEAFGRKYFATCNVETSTSFSIDCTLDHLATFKSNISGYTGFVEYTSSSSRIDITDPRNVPTCNTRIAQSFVDSGMPIDSDGIYILGIIGKQSAALGPATGFVQYWAMTASDIQALIDELHGTIIDDIKEQFNSIMESIISCIWIPVAGVSANIGFGAYTNVYVGRKQLNSVGRPLVRRVSSNMNKALTVTFPMDADIGAPSYLDKSPYSTGTLFLPFVGVVPLDLDALYPSRTINLNYFLDFATGDIVYDVEYGDALANHRIATYSGNFATKVPVSGASYDAIGLVGGTITTIGGLIAAGAAVASGGAVGAAALGAIGGGAAMAAKSCEVHTMINGGASSGLGFALGKYIAATIITAEPSEDVLIGYQAEEGMPYFKTSSLGSLSGYIKCKDASVSIPGNGSEQSVVNGYLNSGFYLE